MPDSIPQSLTVNQVAEAVGVHTDTIRAEIKRGNLVAWWAGRSLRVEPDALEEWKQSKRVKAEPKPPKVSRLRAIEQESRRRSSH